MRKKSNNSWPAVSIKYIFIENCKLTERILRFFAESVGDNRNFTTFALAL